MQLSLPDRQRAVARVCFAREPSRTDLDLLGRHDRWLLYRTMVRDRLRGMIEVGLPRTIELLGEPTFQTWFERWLAEAPPRNRYIRTVLPAFVRFALPFWSEDTGLRPWTADVARYETARWETWYEEEPLQTPESFDFERRPVVNPALRIVRASYPVHRKREAYEGYPASPTNLVVYRTAANEVDVWVFNDVATDLLEAWQPGDRTVTDAVKGVAERRDIELGPEFVDKLSEIIAQFLKRGILLGSR